jgi:O-antigen/teichoic acid export membrane protein
MMVLAFGLQTVLRPRAMRAAAAGDGPTGREVDRTFSAVLAAAAVGYAIVIGPQWPVNPLPQLFPAAYHVSGAVALMVMATSLQNSTSLFSSQIVAARRTRDLVRLSVPNAPLIPLVTVALAAPWGTNAVAAAIIVERTVWYLRYRPIHRRIFAGAADAPAAVAPVATARDERLGEPTE